MAIAWPPNELGAVAYMRVRSEAFECFQLRNFLCVSRTCLGPIGDRSGQRPGRTSPFTWEPFWPICCPSSSAHVGVIEEFGRSALRFFFFFFLVITEPRSLLGCGAQVSNQCHARADWGMPTRVPRSCHVCPFPLSPFSELPLRLKLALSSTTRKGQRLSGTLWWP